jgi:putative phosphoribosyl transferase
VFKDRRDAGEQLAEVLITYKDKNPLVLAIPRGGVAVGYHVARHLQCDFSIIAVRKLPLPDNPEAGFGAIAEDGSTYFDNRAMKALPTKMIERIIKEQKLEIKQRIEVLRNGKPLPILTDRILILVDDGIAMGSTMRAAIMLCKNNNPAKIIVAAPVAGQSIAADFTKLVDWVVILEKPPFFRAVAQVYEDWYDLSDEEVVHILKKADNYLQVIKTDDQQNM